MNKFIFIISLIIFTDLNCCKSQGKSDYSEEKCQMLITTYINELFVPLDEIDYNLLEKSIYKYQDTCLILSSDMRPSSCCVLHHYIIARLISSKYNGIDKYKYLIKLAENLDTSSFITATSYSILINEFLNRYYSSDELANIFPINHLSNNVKEILTEKVILVSVTHNYFSVIKRVLDENRSDNQDYYFALSKYISFCRFSKIETDQLKHEVDQALGESVLNDIQKKSINRLYTKLNEVH